MELIVKPGKSELLFVFRGKHAHQARERLYRESNMQVQFEGPDTTMHIAAVRVYKHVGTQVSFSESMHPEIMHRLPSMRAAASQLRRYFP